MKIKIKESNEIKEVPWDNDIGFNDYIDDLFETKDGVMIIPDYKTYELICEAYNA